MSEIVLFVIAVIVVLDCHFGRAMLGGNSKDAWSDVIFTWFLGLLILGCIEFTIFSVVMCIIELLSPLSVLLQIRHIAAVLGGVAVPVGGIYFYNHGLAGLRQRVAVSLLKGQELKQPVKRSIYDLLDN